MGKKAAPAWRRGFLGALKRTGNVRAAARAAGVDVTTAYNHRRTDARFAAQWVRAVETAAARSKETPPPPCRRSPFPGKAGEELILRYSKRHGPQMVRVAEGRFDAGARKRFLTTLAATGCVARAAAAAGLSREALSKRRAHYPDFAADWAAAEAHAKARLHGLVVAAGIASFDPEAAAEGADAPKVTVSEAIAILRLKGTGPSPAPAAANDAAEPPIEQVRDEVLKRVAAIRRQRASEG